MKTKTKAKVKGGKARAYKKKYAKKQVIPTANTSIGRQVGFPKTMTFKHKYCEQVQLTAASGITHYQYSCNGMYDPNITGIGAQPSFFDNMCAIYNHYKVIGSRCKWRIVPVGTAVQYPFRVVAWYNDDTTTSGTTMSVYGESKGAQTRLCTGVNPSQIVISQKWSLKRTFPGSYQADIFRGTPSTNPNEQTHFQLSLSPLDPVQTIYAHVFVEIEYVAVWSELSDPVAN